MTETDDRKHPFDYHRPTEAQIAEIQRVRESCKATYETLLTLKPSPERTLAMRSLEEVSMWANKSIILDGEEGIEARTQKPLQSD